MGFDSETVCREDEIISFKCPFCGQICQIVYDTMSHNSLCYTYVSMDVEVYVNMCEIEMDRIDKARTRSMS